MLLPGGVIALALALAGCPAPPDDVHSNAEPADPGTAIITWGSWQATPGNFVYPRSVVVVGSDGDGSDAGASNLTIIVADKTRRLQFFDGNGTLRRCVPLHIHPDLSLKGYPVGISVRPTDGRLVVANTHYCELIWMSPDGTEELSRQGHTGSGPGEFMYPVRFAWRPDGGVYVAEYGHDQHRIQQFDTDGNFVRTFGHYGTGDGGFDRINGICTGPDGRVYACDAGNHRIQVFEADGTFVTTFGSFGDEPGQLKIPYGICYEPIGDRLIVAEFAGSRLSVFRRDGTPLGHYTGADLANPWDVQVSQHFAFVPDYRHHRVVRIPLAALPGSPGLMGLSDPGHDREGTAQPR
ncbi:MAG: hypothetical protein AB7K09_02290 [Planctomycetota bacterium]